MTTKHWPFAWSLLLGLVLACVLAVPATAQDGKALFEGNCKSCHALNKKVTGPALRDVHNRWGNDDAELLAWVKNSQAYLKGSGKNVDYAKKLYAEYNNSVMTAFPNPDAELKAILDYIKAESAKPISEPAAAAAGGAGTGKGSGLSISDTALYTGLIVLVATLLIVALALILIVAVLVNAIRAKDSGQPLTPGAVGNSFVSIVKNKYVLTLVVLVLAGAGTNWAVQQARSVGLHKGYQPTQPVAFSHKLHAGQYGISCNYCHIGVEKSRHAVIPSTNICMNCHSYIKEGPKHGPKEIGKVVAAHEAGKPIEWVKIHNLPDFVYFSHAQHVKVGGVQCESCHGDIKEAEEVAQVQDLSMGWCINCHRTRNVSVKSNPYYKNAHKHIGMGTADSLSVEKLGGLSCAKCHY